MGCGNCHSCETRTYCQPLKVEPRPYSGCRFTADCFDCAIQLSLDTYSSCSFDCLYCFSNYLVRNPEAQAKAGNAVVGAWGVKDLENLLDLGRDKGSAELFRSYIRRPGGKRSVIQWGALGDPFDNIERHQGRGLEFIKLFQKYRQPVRVSTKGGLLLQEKTYLDAIGKQPEHFWFAFSCITIDDEVLTRVDRRAPNATERLRAMKALTDMGCRATLRMRPILRNVTDRTAKHPHAWRELLQKARESGAEAVSMEFVFVPGALGAGVKKRWDMIEDITRFPYRTFYKGTSDRHTACLRSSPFWKEDLTFAIREEAHKLGMVFSISDPHWKELNDTGCCCGIKPDDPIFGAWERKQAAEALRNARLDFEAGGKGLVYLKDVVPDWARKIRARAMFCATGVKGAQMDRITYAEGHHRHIWNDVNAPRGPRLYFGTLEPTGELDEDKNLIYRYVPRERRHQAHGWQTK